MKKASIVIMLVVLVLSVVSSVSAYEVSWDFNTAWETDYTPGWQNTAYRHGEAPQGKMMELYSGGRNGTTGLRLVADSTPSTSMFWAGVNPINLSGIALAKQYDPYISVWYYDTGWEDGLLHQTGQIFSVPSWTNNYLNNDTEDWTDVQFGARTNQAPENDKYYYVAAGENSPGWQSTGVARKTDQWINLKMQLSSEDGRIHFYVRDNEAQAFTEVGATYRNDYTDLGTESGLFTMFTTPLSEWDQNKPASIWDDFQVGSNYVPEPTSMILGFMGLSSIAGFKRLRKRA